MLPLLSQLTHDYLTNSPWKKSQSRNDFPRYIQVPSLPLPSPPEPLVCVQIRKKNYYHSASLTFSSHTKVNLSLLNQVIYSKPTRFLII